MYICLASRSAVWRAQRWQTNTEGSQIKNLKLYSDWCLLLKNDARKSDVTWCINSHGVLFNCCGSSRTSIYTSSDFSLGDLVFLDPSTLPSNTIGFVLTLVSRMVMASSWRTYRRGPFLFPVSRGGRPGRGLLQTGNCCFGLWFHRFAPCCRIHV